MEHSKRQERTQTNRARSQSIKREIKAEDRLGLSKEPLWGVLPAPALLDPPNQDRHTTPTGTQHLDDLSAKDDVRYPSDVKPKVELPGEGPGTVLQSTQDRQPSSESRSESRFVVSRSQPPEWYNELKRDKKRKKGDSHADILLATLKDYIKAAGKPRQSMEIKTQKCNEIRERLHKLAFLQVNANLIRNNRMLDQQDGLPQLFSQNSPTGVDWPWDISLDAEELYNKWWCRIFNTEILRGIVYQQGTTGIKLDPKYPDRVSAHYFGNGNLVNGQWWPTRLTMLRDGAHGETQAGIFGVEGKGAYACVMSGGCGSEGNPYPDRDEGDYILYCGTDSHDGVITSATCRMLLSIGSEPVRLIRSRLVKSEYAPEIGYRYDGLYQVVSFEKLDSDDSLRQRHRFRLERVPGQTPLRGGKGPEKRPTAEEIAAYQNMVKGLRGEPL